MFKRKKMFFFFLAVILLMSVLTACTRQSSVTSNTQANTQGNTQANTQAPPKDEVTYSSFMVVATFDPQKGTSSDQSENRAIYSALLDTEAGTHELKPDLAEKYEVSADGLTYTFHLRKGVKFQKGFGEMKASDVVFTFKRLLDPKTASKYTIDFKVLDSVTATDDYTVVFKLKSPYTPFPIMLSDAYMGGYIYSEKAVTQYGDSYNKNPIGTGPYQLEQWIPQNKVVYSAFPDYFGGVRKIKKLTYLEIPDGNTAFMAFRKGEIDAMMVQQPEILDQAKTMPEVNINSIPNLTTYNLFMKTTEKPFDDLRVRQAMNYAIDKNELVKTVFGSVNTPAKGYLPSPVKGFTTDGIKQYEYNPEKAKQLLAEAGYPNGFTLDTKQSAATANQRVFTVLQAQLAKVGVKLNFEAVQIPEWAKYQYSGTAKFGMWPFVTAPEIHFFFSSYYSSAAIPPPTGANGAFYKGVDDLINKAVSEKDWNVRAQLYKQAQVKISEDTPFIPLYESNSIIISNKNLKGLVPGGDYNNDVRFENASW